MSDHGVRLLLAILSTVGLTIAVYLTVVHYQGGVPVCATSGCEVVQRSGYAELFGVPVALLGSLAFAALLASTLTREPLLIAGAAAVALVGVIFAAYLVYVQIAVLDAICVWCLASDAMSAAVGIAACGRLRRELI